MPPEMFEQAVRSLGFKPSDEGGLDGSEYFGVVGVFGGNPATSPHFDAYCEVLRRLVPFEQRGIWCNNPMSVDRAREMARTFDPSVSNLNCHTKSEAYDKFVIGWPACRPVGLHTDSRHSPVHLAAKDVVRAICPDCNGRCTRLTDINPGFAASVVCETCDGTGDAPDYERIWDSVSRCDINQNWSAMLGMFRGQLRAWFCEVAGAQAILHQDDESYPDTGKRVEELMELREPWWQLPMSSFSSQVAKHCPECAVPLRGYGELSQRGDGEELTSATHVDVFKPKRKGRTVAVATDLVQLGTGRLALTTDYLGNAKR